MDRQTHGKHTPAVGTLEDEVAVEKYDVTDESVEEATALHTKRVKQKEGEGIGGIDTEWIRQHFLNTR